MRSQTMANRLNQPNLHFRLIVNEGLKNVSESLAEWSKMGEVEMHTVQYLKTNDVGQKVDQMVELLQGTPITAMMFPFF